MKSATNYHREYLLESYMSVCLIVFQMLLKSQRWRFSECRAFKWFISIYIQDSRVNFSTDQCILWPTVVLWILFLYLNSTLCFLFIFIIHLSIYNFFFFSLLLNFDNEHYKELKFSYNINKQWTKLIKPSK